MVGQDEAGACHLVCSRWVHTDIRAGAAGAGPACGEVDGLECGVAEEYAARGPVEAAAEAVWPGLHLDYWKEESSVFGNCAVQVWLWVEVHHGVSWSAWSDLVAVDAGAGTFVGGH